MVEKPLPSLRGLTDDLIAEALEEVDLRIVVVVLAQVTRDPCWFSDRYRPAYDAELVGAPSAGLSPDAQAEVREAARDLLIALRDDTFESDLPTETEVVELMRLCTAEKVPVEYAKLMLEELGGIPREASWSRPDHEQSRFNVVIIGAGVSGICAAMKLEKLGIAYTVIERNRDVGGTWLVNDYPACGVDTPNHLYSYSFAPNPRWPGYFVKRDSIHEYLRRSADEFGIFSHIRFGCEVEDLRYDEDRREWLVRLRDETGAHSSFSANAVISAVGQLTTPKRPEIDGLDDFEGPCFHTAEWRHDVELADKRVGVVGTGASAMQLLRPVSDRSREVTVFQRTPPWVMPQAAYSRKVSEGTKLLLEVMPFFQAWLRFSLFWGWGDSLLQHLIVDPEWPYPERSLNSRHDLIRENLTNYVRAELGDHEDLFHKALPKYPPFGKRMLLDNQWYETLTRPNVNLVTDSITRVSQCGIVTDDGSFHELDVIILATGFNATELLDTLEVRGRNNRLLSDAWNTDDARAYLGITMPDFPNFFCLYGPNTGLAHGGSIIFHSECQVRYVMECLVWMIEHEVDSIECRQEVHDRYNERVDAAHADMVWSHPGVNNWYRNRNGRVVGLSPWRLIDYWGMTREPEMSDFVVSRHRWEAR